jgi:hypothetical protein
MNGVEASETDRSAMDACHGWRLKQQGDGLMAGIARLHALRDKRMEELEAYGVKAVAARSGVAGSVELSATELVKLLRVLRTLSNLPHE